MSNGCCWIVYNGSLVSHKFTELTQWLQESYAEQGVECLPMNSGSLPVVVANGATALRQGLERPDFVLFWDKDVRLGLQLEAMGLRLFNSAGAVATCDDKALTHIALANHGAPMPRTVVAPLVFPGMPEPDGSFLDRLEGELAYPMVVKECFGSFGAQVYLAHNREELTALHQRLLHTPHLYQQFVATSYGRDVRVQVVGGQAVAAVLRRSEHDFRANVTNGGHMEPFAAPDAFLRLAERCCDIIGLDFAGVDMLFGEDNEPVLCEVNSNAHFKNLYHATGVDVARLIAAHTVRVMADG